MIRLGAGKNGLHDDPCKGTNQEGNEQAQGKNSEQLVL